MATTRRLMPLLIAVFGTLSFALVGWLGFQLGRYRAGYDLFDARRVSEQLEATIAEQAEAIESLERQVAILETAREIDREAYANVEANLDELELQLVDRQEELRFYQGIVSPEDGEMGLRVQDFAVESGAAEHSYTIRLVLVQAMVHNERVSGSVVLSVNGMSDGQLVTLELDSIAAAELVDGVAYDFRYFQAVEFPLTLPAGFIPQSVDVEVIPERRADTAWTRNFAWPG